MSYLLSRWLKPVGFYRLLVNNIRLLNITVKHFAIIITMNINNNKKCFVCQNVNNLPSKPNSIYKDRFYWICRSCKSAKMRRYYEDKKNLVFEHYGNICNCCKETNQQFLTVDHIDNDGTAERWGSGSRIVGVQLYQKIVKANYPIKYQLLCMNCNFGKRMNGGVCPHTV